MRAVACGTHSPYPAAPAAMLPARNGPYLSLLRQAPGLRPEPLALHGRHQAALRREPPEGSDRRERRAQACVRLHALPQGGQGHEGLAASQSLVADPSLIRFRSVVEAALAQLEARREE